MSGEIALGTYHPGKAGPVLAAVLGEQLDDLVDAPVNVEFCGDGTVLVTYTKMQVVQASAFVPVFEAEK